MKKLFILAAVTLFSTSALAGGELQQLPNSSTYVDVCNIEIVTLKETETGQMGELGLDENNVMLHGPLMDYSVDVYVYKPTGGGLEFNLPAYDQKEAKKIVKDVVEMRNSAKCR